MIPKITNCDYDHIILNDDNPQLIHIKNFISLEECSSMINYISKLKSVPAKGVENGKSIITKDRNAMTFENWLGKWGDENLMNIDKRIMKLVEWESFRSENWQFIKYGIGQKYRPHFDYFKKIDMNQLYRQRCGTFIIYLQKAKKGGSTCFPYLKKTIEAENGDAIFFNYIPEETEKSYHGGTTVVEGEKIIVTRWFNFLGTDQSALSYQQNQKSPL
jgi:prolyl 4-hydroxylase